jgi:gamma-glutamylcyclotransferase (GGCT)/AIG2-like uncharacterized protein YtfP
VITDLFVYGTLRPGQLRWPFLEPFVTDEGHDESVAGTLYDTGHGYPAARFEGSGTIRGRIFALRHERLSEALAVLDEVEGAVLDLFDRVAVTTVSGREAWAYQLNGASPFVEIASGDWSSR